MWIIEYIFLSSSIVQPQLGNNIPLTAFLSLPIASKKSTVDYFPTNAYYVNTVNDSFLSDFKVDLLNENKETVNITENSSMLLILHFQRNT